MVKIQLVGDAATGKSSFVKYCEFSEFQQTSLTLGPDIKYIQLQKLYRDKTVAVQIRDVPGQFDRFRSLIKSQYRGIHGCVLMCSLDDIESVKSLKKNWIKEVYQHAPDNIYCIVLLNKYDKINESGIDQQTLLQYQKVEKMAREFAQDNGYPLYNTSCATGAYVHTSLKELVDRIVRDQQIWNQLLNTVRNSSKSVLNDNTKVHKPRKRKCKC